MGITMRTLRAGVVGVGYLGNHHARILKELEGVELAGVFDIDPAAGNKAKDKYRCELFDSKEALAQDVDLVVVATPTLTHRDVACFFLDQGIHVMVEKPIAHTLDAAREIVETASASGAKLQVGHSERFNPAFVAASEFISGPLFMETNRLARLGPRGLDVDVVLDLMIHDIDLVASCIPVDPSMISAVGVPVLTDSVDMANVRLEFPNGAAANLVASRTSLTTVRKVRLFQPDTYMSVDLLSHKVRMYKRLGKMDTDKPLNITQAAKLLKSQSVKVDKFEPLRAELRSFVNSAQRDERPIVSGRDGLRALDWAFSIKNSIEQHLERTTGASHPSNGTAQ